MKLLAISDIHGNSSRIPSILGYAGKVDAILVAGDITNFGPDEKAREILNVLNEHAPVMAVPGNCDPKSVLDVIGESGVINLHNSSFKLGDVTFAGVGGSNQTPFDTPFEMSEDEIREILQRVLQQVKRNGKIVLVSHAPPKNTLDEIAGTHAGSEAVREVLDQFDLIVCGHIHEARGVMKVGNTTIVNPGQASRGYAALIDVDDEIKVTFNNPE